MFGMWTGVGIVAGAAIGILLSLLVFDDWELGSMIVVGVVAGLIIGAVADAYGRRR